MIQGSQGDRRARRATAGAFPVAAKEQRMQPEQFFAGLEAMAESLDHLANVQREHVLTCLRHESHDSFESATTHFTAAAEHIRKGAEALKGE